MNDDYSNFVDSLLLTPYVKRTSEILCSVLAVFVIVVLSSGFVLYRWHGVIFILVRVCFVELFVTRRPRRVPSLQGTQLTCETSVSCLSHKF